MKSRANLLLKAGRGHVGAGAHALGPEEEAAVLEVLRSKSLFRYYGPAVPRKVAQFEGGLAERIGSRFALGVSSGTAALYVALKATGVDAGDRVILSCFNFLAPYLAIRALGAEPVFADVDESLAIDPASVRALTAMPVKALIVTHMLGAPCAMDDLLAVAHRHAVPVIEDCAQAFGATYHQVPVGSLGDIGVFSFQAQKLITCGEGGAVTTSQPELYRRAAFVHDNSQMRTERELPENPAQFLGLNFRMDELRAAILVEQLKKADAILRALRTARQFLMQELGKELLWKLSHDQDGDNGTVCAVLAPSVARRRYAQLALKAAGFEAHTLYGGTIWTAWPHIVPAPPHRAAFQATELRLNRLLCVNLRPDLTEAHLAMLCWILKHTLS